MVYKEEKGNEQDVDKFPTHRVEIEESPVNLQKNFQTNSQQVTEHQNHAFVFLKKKQIKARQLLR